MAALNLSLSAASLAKALAVRMPEMEDSTSPLMPASLAFTSVEARIIRFRLTAVKRMNRGITAKTMRASCHRMVSMTQKAPRMVTEEMNRSSGPWWASSVISNRSPVTRLMSWPVRFWS